MLKLAEQLENIAFSPKPVETLARVANARVLAKVPALAHRLYDGEGRECVACGATFGRFAKTHRPQHLGCPFCGAIDRDLFHLLVLERMTDLFDGSTKKVLHIAPEPILEKRFREAPGIDYLSGDLMRPDVMAKVDICNMTFEDRSFHAAICSHVLEHVPDDRTAMAEFARVLELDGYAMFSFPIGTDPTTEDPTLTDRRARIRRFGQIDHLRMYGPDVVDRFTEAGFDVTTVRPTDLCDRRDLTRYGLDGGADLVAYLCKPKG
jgi:hypothetical protein